MTLQKKGGSTMLKYTLVLIHALQPLGMARPAQAHFHGSVLLAILLALSMVLMPQSAKAQGNLIASVTQDPTVAAVTIPPPGTVYIVTTEGDSITVCTNTPVSGTSPPDLQYKQQCATGAASDPVLYTPYKGFQNYYSAVVVLGYDPTSEKVHIAAADITGNIYTLYLKINGTGDADELVPVNNTPPVNYCLKPDQTSLRMPRVQAMAVDPNKEYLYISCLDTRLEGILRGGDKPKNAYNLTSADLVIVPINTTDYTLGSARVKSYENYYWSGSVQGISGSLNLCPADGHIEQSCDDVDPKLTVYPPSYAGLQGSSFYASGAVFYSSIISGLDGIYPTNTGLMCLDGVCDETYNFPFCGNSTCTDGTFSVMTAAEFGVATETNSPNNPVPVLFWSQHEGFWGSGITNNFGQINRNYPGYYSLIKKGLTRVVQCQRKLLINPYFIGNGTQCDESYVKLDWPPLAVTGVNNSSRVDQMMWVPTPPAGACEDPSTGIPCLNEYTGGLLVMGTTDNGYLAYRNTSFLNSNTETGYWFGSDGVGGNVNSLSSDANGNVLYHVGSQGLFGFNPFFNTSPQLNELVYIPVPADTNTPLPVVQSLGIISDVITIAGVFAIEGSEPTVETIVPQRQLAGSSMQRFPGGKRNAEIQPNSPNSVLALLLGEQSYWAEFTYSEEIVKVMGVHRGDWINGVQMRLAEGIAAAPEEDLMIDSFRIGLASDRTQGNGNKNSPSPSPVFDGSLCVTQQTFNRDAQDGYGPTIPFDHPFHYLGGDLTLAVKHSGSGDENRFYLDALRGNGVSGSYEVLESMHSTPENITQINVAPTLRFSSGRRFLPANDWDPCHTSAGR